MNGNRRKGPWLSGPEETTSVRRRRAHQRGRDWLLRCEVNERHSGRGAVAMGLAAQPKVPASVRVRDVPVVVVAGDPRSAEGGGVSEALKDARRERGC